MALQVVQMKFDAEEHARNTLFKSLGIERSLLREHLLEALREINLAGPDEVDAAAERLQYWTAKFRDHADKVKEAMEM